MKAKLSQPNLPATSEAKTSSPVLELSVIVPCLNEEANVEELVARVKRVFAVELLQCGAELILVDDGSTDATGEMLSKLSGSENFVVARRHSVNLGIPAAWRTGMMAARGRLICVLDADMQYQPEDILKLYQALSSSSAEIAQGWRSPTEREKGARYWISRGCNLMLNRAFAMSLRDNKSGFILCSREVFADLLGYVGNYNYWQIFIMAAAQSKGYTCAQIETRFLPRRAGKSFLSDVPVRVMLGACRDFCRAVVEYRLGRKRKAARQFSNHLIER
jgi:phenylacetate-CoA ligase